MTRAPETIIDCADGQGTFSKLPRELRDKIYRYLVKGRYIVALEPTSAGVAKIRAGRKTRFNIDAADFSILRVSKSIGGEALALLYAESTFESCLSFLEDRPYTHYAKGFTDRMIKVKFHVDGLGIRNLFRECFTSRDFEDVCKSFLDYFTGTDITRTSIKIILIWAEPFNRYGSSLYESSLFESFKQLGGFRRVRVEFHFAVPASEKKDPQLGRGQVDEVMWGAEQHLKSTLGLASAGYFSKPGSPDFYGYLTFQPTERLLKTSEQEVKHHAGDA